jgi:virginiamycin B lyase
MPSATRIIYKRSFFAFFIAVLGGCSAQHASLLPSPNQGSANQATTTQARIVSSSVRAGGKTYVIDQMYTPVNTTLGGITSGSDGNVWFTGHGVVGKSSVAGDMTDYAIPLGDDIASITEGPDHNFWMTSFPGAIDRITSAGQFDSFPVPKQFGGTSAGVFSIASGFGDLWTLDPYYNADYMLEITPQGKFHGFKLGPGSQGVSLTGAHDGSIWFTDYRNNSIAHMTAPGKFKRYAIPTRTAGPESICQAANGTLWFIESAANKIASMTLSGTFKEYVLPAGDAGATSIVEGPDGALWLTETNQIVRMTTSGAFTVLPVKGKYDYNYLAQITVGGDKNIWFTEGSELGLLGRVELHDLKKSDPEYQSIALTLEKQPQLGVAQSIPLTIEVRDLHGKIMTGKYPYPIHLSTTDPQNAGLSKSNVTTSEEKIGVKFSGADAVATIAATANGGARLTPAAFIPSTPQEYPLPSQSYNMALATDGTIWMCLRNGHIATRTPGGTIHDYKATTSLAGCSIVEAPDGNMWFTDYSNARIGKITPQGKVTFTELGYRGDPMSMTVGGDGALWFTQPYQDKIDRLTTDGQLTSFKTPSDPQYIVTASDGDLWYDDENYLYKMTLKGKQTRHGREFQVNIVPLWSANGELWYTNYQKLYEIDATGKVIARYTYPGTCYPNDVVVTPDGNVWYYDSADRCVGRITPSGTATTVLTYNRDGGYSPSPDILYGPNNDIWFNEPGNKGLGWIDPTTL